MEWRFVHNLQSEDLITDYEKTVKYCFPDDFKNCIKIYNGAYPILKVFTSFKGKRKRKRVFNHLFSFNKEDVSKIWSYNDWNGGFHDWNEDGKMENYVAFAGDPFGNLICFDKTNDKIVFIDHETLDIESVADSFTELVNSLRKS